MLPLLILLIIFLLIVKNKQNLRKVRALESLNQYDELNEPESTFFDRQIMDREAAFTVWAKKQFPTLVSWKVNGDSRESGRIGYQYDGEYCIVFHLEAEDVIRYITICRDEPHFTFSDC